MRLEKRVTSEELESECLIDLAWRRPYRCAFQLESRDAWNFFVGKKRRHGVSAPSTLLNKFSPYSAPFFLLFPTQVLLPGIVVAYELCVCFFFYYFAPLPGLLLSWEHLAISAMKSSYTNRDTRVSVRSRTRYNDLIIKKRDGKSSSQVYFIFIFKVSVKRARENLRVSKCTVRIA